MKGVIFLKQTANYGLNQWDEEDRILRTDFNGDNAKVDAAIKAEAERVGGMPHGILLCGGMTTAAAEQVDLDVSRVDWGCWLFAGLEIQLPATAQMRLYINGATSSNCAHGYLGSTAYSTGELGFLGAKSRVSLVVIPALYSGTHPFQAINASSEGTFGICMVGLNTVSQFTLVVYPTPGALTIPAGTIFRLWGVR